MEREFKAALDGQSNTFYDDSILHLQNLVRAYVEKHETVATESDGSVGHASDSSGSLLGKDSLLSTRFQSSLPIRVINFNRFNSNLSKFKNLFPSALPVYTVQNKTHQKVIDTLTSSNVKLNIGTKSQIKAVKNSNPKADIFFGHPLKTLPNLSYAARSGVNVVTFDSEVDLVKIAKYLGLDAKCILILNTNATLPLSQGAPLEKVHDLLNKIKSLGLNFHGVSFEILPDIDTETSDDDICGKFHRWIKVAKSTMVMAEAMGLGKYGTKLLQIGTSIFGAVQTDNEIAAIAKAINIDVKNHFPDFTEKNIWVACDTIANQKCVDVAAQIVDVKYENSGEITYFLNDGVYNSFRGKVGGSAKPSFESFDKYGCECVDATARFVGESRDYDLDVLYSTKSAPVLEVGYWVYWTGLNNVGLKDADGFVYILQDS